MKSKLTWMVTATLLTLLLAGCANSGSNQTPPEETGTLVPLQKTPLPGDEPFEFEVDPDTFALTIIKDGVREQATLPLPKSKVTNLVKKDNSVSWTYPGRMNISITKKDHYLDIQLESVGAESFEWPIVQADSYMLPLGEGKRIPADDKDWKTFLRDQTYTFSESFSMDFFALNHKSFSMVYLVNNKFNDEVHFDTEPSVQMQFSHDFPAINPDKSYGFRLYVTGNDPQQIVQPYKNKVIESGNFVTLEQKADGNPNIRKLYGAPQIYLWSPTILTDENVNWPKMKTVLNGKLGAWLKHLMDETADGSSELADTLKQLSGQDYMDNYQKKVVLSALNQAVRMKEFYSAEMFPDTGTEATALIQQGVSSLSEQKLYELNKLLLKDSLGEAAADLKDWGQAGSTDLIKAMHDAGIDKAWIGLSNWADGLINPAMVNEAASDGYLIAPYDSYHSIQEKPDPSWNTASFPDSTLYEEATITRKDGSKVAGFLNRGRKLNPTLALPSVKQRADSILKEGIAFNSWFVDCDATGEIFDDYSPAHLTTQSQDLDARLQRLSYYAKDKQMVVGSEGGNDYASGVIAYAQGIESPIIAWGDPDMRDNKDSEYYVGGYYAMSGIPERYGKAVPVKPLYDKVYLDPTYSLPLYKLVYNNSVITTNHWEWGSYKIKGAEAERMLYELLYNAPPLYHLDEAAWKQQQASITGLLKVWSPFHSKAIMQEMTKFSVLSDDRLVQSAEYGDQLKVTVNFSDKDFAADGQTVKAKSAVITEDGKTTVFDAQANAKLLTAK
ncbi:glycoside hydrolase [Paenibacillus sp. ATY16]|uniref:glycoside hydrolase n=1 Tax=Paenibacillus sp. ATY16 TaxID=1759312 RepID=UPI00201006A3|nr:glycoside hydrolase [Paenibacillus sp. ATY16]MCK9861118.1 glycoside hydrolase [Paenibacillus sp. ATY16]